MRTIEKRIILLEINGEYILGDGVSVGAQGGHDEVILRMKFSKNWEGTTKRVEWINALGESVGVTIITPLMLCENSDDTFDVSVPGAVKEHGGEITITVEGVIIDEETSVETVSIRTEEATFRVLKSFSGITEQDDIIPSQAEQLQAEIDAIDKEFGGIIKARDHAQAAAGVASDAANLAMEAKDDAQSAAGVAGDAADLARKAKDDAEKARDDAQSAADDVENNSLNAVNASLFASEAKSKAINAAANAEIQSQKAESAADIASAAAGDARDYAEAAQNAAECVSENAGVFANAIKVTKTGTIVTLDDVSPIKHKIACSVKSKNLIPFPYESDFSVLENAGLTVTDNGDGTFVLNGTTSKSQVAFWFAKKIQVNAGVTYYFNSGTDKTSVSFPSGYSNPPEGIHSYNEYSFTAKRDDTIGLQLYISYEGTTFDNVLIKPQLEVGDVATEFTPYNPEGIVVSVIKEGVTTQYTSNADGTVTGIMSAPSMTISTDTEGATLSIEYNQDTTVAVKSALTDNSLEWTEEEKASARNLIGVGDTNTIPMSRTGELLTLSNISSTEHELGVKATAKNLITSKPDFTPLINMGLEVTDNGDGSYTVNGMADDEEMVELTVFDDVELEVGKTYVLSSNIEHINGSGPSYANVYYSDGGYASFEYEPFMATQSKCKAIMNFVSGFPYENFTFAPQLEVGNVPTEFAPPIDIENATVSVLGKNMVILEPHTEDFYGATITYGEDGGISINGKINHADVPNGGFVTVTSFEVPLDKNAEYVITTNFFGEYANDVFMQVAIYDSDDNHIDTITYSGDYIIVKNLDKIIIKIGLINHPEWAGDSCKIQIEAGEIPTPFEKGVVTEYKPNPSGIVEGIKSSPKMTLKAKKGAVLDVDYKVDTKTYIDEKFAELAKQIV